MVILKRRQPTPEPENLWSNFPDPALGSRVQRWRTPATPAKPVTQRDLDRVGRPHPSDMPAGPTATFEDVKNRNTDREDAAAIERAEQAEAAARSAPRLTFPVPERSPSTVQDWHDPLSRDRPPELGLGREVLGRVARILDVAPFGRWTAVERAAEKIRALKARGHSDDAIAQTVGLPVEQVRAILSALRS